MSRIDPFRLPRPERKLVTRLFTADGYDVEFSFRRPDAADMNRAAETAKRLVMTYITGSPAEGIPPCEFFDGIKVSESLFLLCASAEEMQPPDLSARYSAEDFVMWLDRLEEDGPKVAGFINEMIYDWRRGPNSRALRTDSPSVEQSASVTNTSKSPSGETSSSPPSTSDSENSAGALERIPART